MAKILVGELRDTIKSMDISSIKTINFNDLEIEIKQYLPIAEKLTLIKSIFESAIDRENGLHILNGNSLDIAFRVLLVEKYTNLNLPKNIIESYDMLVSSGLYNFIYENIPATELSDINMALNNHIDAERDEYDQKNFIEDRNLKFEKVVKDGIDKFLIEFARAVDKLPEKDGWGDIFKDAKDSLNSLDINKMNFLKAAIDWNNGVEK